MALIRHLSSRWPLTPIIQNVSVVAILWLISLVLGFIVSIALARWLGASAFGEYTYALSWVGLLGMLSVFGCDRLMVRQVAVYSSQAVWDGLRGLLVWANGLTLLFSLALFGLIYLLHPFFAKFIPLPFPAGWVLVAFLISGVALSRIQQSTLRGSSRPAAAQFPEMVLLPTVLLLLTAFAAWAGSGKLTVLHALSAYTVAVWSALGLGIYQVFRGLPRQVKAAPTVTHSRVWIVVAAHLFLLSGMDVLNSRIDTLALGVLNSPDVVGVYSAAFRGASLISFGLNIVIIALAPSFARLYAAGDSAGLQAVATKASWLAFLGGMPVAFGMLLAGRWFLLLFGQEFIYAQTALMILCVGQVINVAAGPVVSLLTMTGHERDALVGLGVSTGINFLLSLALIPRWGVNGAAAAAAAGLVIWNVILVGFVWRRLRINPTVFVPARLQSSK